MDSAEAPSTKGSGILGPERVRLFGLVALVVIASGICLYYARFELVDDAYISLRYAANLAAGHGPVFNVGERVEGYTNFLWMLLLSMAAWLGLDLPRCAQVLGALSAILTVAVTGRFPRPRSERPSWTTLLAPALLLCNLTLLFWAVHGLETALFTLLLTLALRADALVLTERVPRIPSGVWYALAAATRPEGLALFGASLCYSALRGRPFWSSREGRKSVAAFAALFLPYWTWRFAYYGYPLPNTFYAKVGTSSSQLVRGLLYVGSLTTGTPVNASPPFFQGVKSLMFLTLIPPLARVRREAVLGYLYWMAAAYFALIVLEGGDGFPAYRFIVPILPAVFLLVEEGLVGLARAVWRRAPRPALVSLVPIVFAILVGVHAFHVQKEIESESGGATRFVRAMKRVAASLRGHVPPSTRIALNFVGVIPYFSGLYAYDMLGLTDAHIAHTSPPDLGSGMAGHEKGDGAYILGERPEIILLGNVNIVGQLPPSLDQLAWRVLFRSEAELVNDPRLVALYTPDALPLDDGRYVCFFRRKDFEIRDRRRLER